MSTPLPSTQTCCLVVGGGPAGMMLGYLLARAGLSVTVLEKHKDFFRDFRGDTVHPSTLELMYELGLLDEFLKVPHQKLSQIGASFGDTSFIAADLRHLPTHCRFVALMPQWDFLNFLASHARRFPTFDLRLEHEAIDLLRDDSDGRIIGVVARTPNGVWEKQASLIIACDGRHSTLRKAAGLPVTEYGAPIDVLWFRLPRTGADSGEQQSLGHLNYGKFLILINRGDYFQVGFIIRKDSFPDLQRQGLPAFRQSLVQVAPFLQDRVDELKDWDEIKLLSVQINRLERWHLPGLLCIGDAAHAMSPVGGVGVNLAIQDAVAAANRLAPAFLEHSERTAIPESVLAAIQNRRVFPTRVTQAGQRAVHTRLQWIFDQTGPLRMPWQLKFLLKLPGFQRTVARLIAVGVRPEHVQSPPSRPRHPERSVRHTACYAALGAAIGAAIALALVKGTDAGRQP